MGLAYALMGSRYLLLRWVAEACFSNVHVFAMCLCLGYVVSVLSLTSHHIPSLLLQRFGLPPRGEPNLAKWERIASRMDTLALAAKPVVIAMVGKYTGMPDTYLSILRTRADAPLQ